MRQYDWSFKTYCNAATARSIASFVSFNGCCGGSSCGSGRGSGSGSGSGGSGGSGGVSYDGLRSGSNDDGYRVLVDVCHYTKTIFIDSDMCDYDKLNDLPRIIKTFGCLYPNYTLQGDDA